MLGKAFAVALCMLGFAATAFAQQRLAIDVQKADSGTTESAPLPLHRQVAEVGVQLSVTDHSGKPVTKLFPDDLHVLDDGIPAPITAPRREDELPLRIALVIDWSDSMRRNLGFERAVALDFLRNVLRPQTDQAMVVGFRYRVEVTQPLTSSLQSLEAGLRPVVGAPLSSVYDALIVATDRLRNANPYIAQRRAILLLSDGEDNVSAHGMLDAIQAAQRANVTIYTIAPPARSAGHDVLIELARVTGGRAFFISRSAEQPAFVTIRRDLKAGYTLYFKPHPGNGSGLRSLEVTARDKNLQVWAPHSYYAAWE